MKNIAPCLWFDGQAEEAANFYASIFPNSRVGTVTHYGPAGSKASGRPEGSVMTVEFEINGQEFLILNGGPVFKFDEAISFMVQCESQEEIDRYWAALTANGGQESVCGWVKDRFGLSWQIVPSNISEFWKNGTAEQLDRVMAAVTSMTKLDLAEIDRAYRGD